MKILAIFIQTSSDLQIGIMITFTSVCVSLDVELQRQSFLQGQVTPGQETPDGFV